MVLLDGKALSLKILDNVKEKVSKLNKIPHLVVVLVGDDSASKIYVNNKKKAAEKVGIKSTIIELPSDTKESDLLNKIKELNNDNDVTGILVQLPLPEQIDKNKVITTISPKKDVDGFSPETFCTKPIQTGGRRKVLLLKMFCLYVQSHLRSKSFHSLSGMAEGPGKYQVSRTV